MIHLHNSIRTSRLPIEARKNHNLLEAERVKAQKLDARVREAEPQLAELPSLREKVSALDKEIVPLRETAQRLPAVEAGKCFNFITKNASVNTDCQPRMKWSSVCRRKSKEPQL